MKRTVVWLLSVLALPLMMACAETNPPAGFVWGRVKTAENQPAPNVAIGIARLEDGKTVDPVVTTTTDTVGRYLIDVSGFPSGDYLVMVNPGISMAGGHVGGQTVIALNGPRESRHLDWTLTQNPPVLPDPR